MTKRGGTSALLTASQLARLCAVDLKTIHNWADKGAIRHYRTPGRHLRFRQVDVLEFLRRFGYPVPPELRAGTRPRVVLVDDETQLVAAARRSLAAGYELTTFQDPVEALVAVGRLQPDAFVVGAEVAGIDSQLCFERLRRNTATTGVRCVVWGGRDDPKAPTDVAVRAVRKRDVASLRLALDDMLGAAS